MAFNESLDRALGAKDVLGCIEVKLCQYNGGAPKVQVTRYEQKGTTRVYGKLGRMTVQEAQAVSEALREVSGIALVVAANSASLVR